MKISLRLLVVIFWAAMMFWLYNRDIKTGEFLNYQDVIDPDNLIRNEWMTVSMQGGTIGVVNSRMDINENSRVHRYVIEDVAELHLNLMGNQQSLDIEVRTLLDVDMTLQAFECLVETSLYPIRIQGRRYDGDVFDISTSTRGERRHKRVKIPRDSMINNPFAENTLASLAVGDIRAVRYFDPLEAREQTVTIEAVEATTIERNGESQPVTRMIARSQGDQTEYWVNKKGRIVRQHRKTFDWVIEQCTFEEAQAALRMPASGEDLLRAVSIPVNNIAHARSRDTLHLRLHGVTLQPDMLTSPRQTIAEVGHQMYDITINKRAAPQPATSSKELSIHRMPTDFIQSRHPDVIRTAKRIVGNEVTPAKQARLLADWVHKNMTRQNAMSIPSTIDVLRTMKGDCNEHTYLFVGLARALGIPAKVKVGLVYMEGAFFYHAWPAYYADGWIENDPTLGQHIADATHIAFTEGEISQQLTIVRLMGRLSIESFDKPHPVHDHD